MLDQDIEPRNSGHSLTWKQKLRATLSIFSAAFLAFFGLGFLLFRPHGLRGVLWLALDVLGFFASSFALVEVVGFLRRKSLDWTERMALSTTSQSEESADVLYSIGQRYRTADGVPQDYEKAAFLFRRAAELGDARAQLELGNLCCDGKGVPQDYTQAAAWYRRAAEQGSPWAQYILGGLYDKGQGVSQNYAEAYFWYAMTASNLGHPLAGTSFAKLAKGPAEHRDEVASHLTPGDLSREQERARKRFEAHRAKP